MNALQPLIAAALLVLGASTTALPTAASGPDATSGATRDSVSPDGQPTSSRALRRELERSMEQLVGNALRARWHAPGGSGAEATHRFELIEIESLVLGPTHARARVWGFWSSPGATPTMLQTDLLLDRHDHAVSHIRVQAYTADSPDARLTAAFGPAGHTDPNGTRILATSL